MPEPSNEQWLDLYQAFREYCESAPWEWLDNSDVVAVEHPSGEYKGYCVVLGDGGIEYGLAVYNGDEGLAHYLELMAGELGGETPEVLDTVDALSALLADREVLSTTDRDIIRNLGLRYRGRGKWPIFRSIKPGYAPWRPEADEAVFLTQALRVIMGVAARVETGELALYLDESPDLILTQVLRQGEWYDQWETLTPPPPRLPRTIPMRRGCNSWPSPRPEAATPWSSVSFISTHQSSRSEASDLSSRRWSRSATRFPGWFSPRTFGAPALQRPTTKSRW